MRLKFMNFLDYNLKILSLRIKSYVLASEEAKITGIFLILALIEIKKEFI